MKISSASFLWLMVSFGLMVLLLTKGGLKASHQPWVLPSFLVQGVSGGGADEVSFNVVHAPPNERNDSKALGVLGGGGGGGGGGEETRAGFVFRALNRSTSPPIYGLPKREIGRTVTQNEDTMNFTSIDTQLLPLNESQVHSNNTIIRRRFSKLEKLEAKMQLAREAIRDAKFGNESFDSDYVPNGPVYWNAKSFHRSYLEMEKQFKVFVYEEGEPPIFHNGHCASIYALEGYFLNQIENTRFRTRDPDKAHVFFLPVSVVSIVHYIHEKISGADQWHPMKQTIIDYINLVARRYSYWNRSIGADHFMLSCHDWGPELSKSVPELYGNSIRALCNANTTEGFDPGRDVSIPEINLPKGSIKDMIGGPSPSKRPVLVFFAGGLHGPIRPILLEHWENKDEDVQIHKYLPKGVSYYGMVKKSRYCICASGYEVASPRMVEAIYMGCVPVLIKDGYAPPFSDVLNWKSFAIIIPVNDIPNLKKILSGISSKQYIRLQRRGKQIRRHFEVNVPPKRYDVFHMILHSVWLRRLNLRIHDVDEQ